MTQRYDPNIEEKKWQQFWEENKTYQFHVDSDKEIYSIDTPPPTVSGKMHMGHAFGNSQQDFVARYKRMQGYNVLQPFGTDDNGLPTQTLIQKLKKVKAQDMDRKEFTQLCLQTLKEELRPTYLNDWKKLGISCDWNISYTTIDKHCQKISQQSFIELYEMGRAFQQEAATMWCPKCQSKNLVGEKDIINTWATSSLTPTIVKELFKGTKVYDKIKDKPFNLRPQGHDIISFWLFNTVVKSHLHYNIKPWNDCFINGWMLDPQGKKMSKSKGNIIEPQVMIEKYSADALRYMAGSVKLGEDLAFPEKEMVAGQKTVNKIWNAATFANMHLESYNQEKPENLQTFDKWMLSKLSKIIKENTQQFDNYEYSKVKSNTDILFWKLFCDNYLEIVKDRLYNPDKRGQEEKVSGQYTLYTVLLDILKMYAPFVPHITEAVYQNYFKEEPSIHLTKWPTTTIEDNDAELAGDYGVDIINTVRKFKSENKVSLKTEIEELIISSKDNKFAEIIETIKDDLMAVTKAKKIVIKDGGNVESDQFKLKIGLKLVQE